MSYAAGDLSDAFKYAQAAIDDALFSNVQFRTAQMAEFYSIINASYQAKEARSKSTLQHYMLLISLLSVVLALLFAYLYKQLRKLSRTKEELSQANLRLTQLNDELNDKNAQLSDSNDLKEQYIARFFDLCSLYIDKMDSYRKTLNRLAQNRQFDELFKRLKSTSMMENELDELYKNFDAIFLNLYPTFVADFNSLLIPEERIALRPGDLLNKELRIYALLRMGITDSAKIASFLRCSLSTVYNYRTKMRNKAALSREKFEKMVSEIGNTPVKEPQ
jgi:DNA-binding CsgD family transcriptional regulator/cell division protein FtsB